MPRRKPTTPWVKRIRSVSKKRNALLMQYRHDRKDFLVKNPWCAWGLALTPPQYIRATQIHHTRGRAGKLLLDQRYWLGLCEEGHNFVHRNIAKARAMKLICEKGKWGRVD